MALEIAPRGGKTAEADSSEGIGRTGAKGKIQPARDPAGGIAVLCGSPPDAPCGGCKKTLVSKALHQMDSGNCIK